MAESMKDKWKKSKKGENYKDWVFSLLTVPMSINIIAKNSNHVYIRLGQITRDYDFFLKVHIS